MRRALVWALCCVVLPPSFAVAVEVHIDDAYVVQAMHTGDNRWAASGGADKGEADADTWVQYRRKRGIEVASGCVVDRVLSHPKDTHLVATVTGCGR